MTTYGLLSTGFSPKTYTIIKAEIEAAFQAVFGNSINLDPQSVFGQIIGIMAERESELWDIEQDIYNNFNPDSATGSALDALAALTGSIREQATHSTVTATLGVDAGTTVPAGSTFSLISTGVQFVTLAAATAVGTFVTVGVACQAVLTGPLVALATGTAGWQIDSPVAGWNTVMTALDADPGADVETDPELRVRREIELRSAANAALEAIRTAVLDAGGGSKVTECVVFENVSMVVDADGIPAKAVEVVVDQGTATDAEIEEAIFESVAAGIEAHGDNTGTVVDSQGISHTIGWSEATEVDCYVTATVTYDADHFPVDGAAQVLAAILAYGDGLVMGYDVIANAVGAPIFSIAGVLNCVVLVGSVNPPVSTSVPITIRQLGVFDSTRTTVTLVAGTP